LRKELLAPEITALSPEILLALTVYAAVASVTPGPNTLMLLASGVNFGFRRTIPHILGVVIGFSVMVVLVGLGLVGLFLGWPAARQVLQAVSVAYMLWLAWRIANAAPPEGTARPARPFGFLLAAGFQWVNPKAWVMAVGAIAIYAPGQDVASILMVAAVFTAVNVPSAALWTGMGGALRHWMQSPPRRRLFNRTMAVLLVLSLYPVLADGFGGG